MPGNLTAAAARASHRDEASTRDGAPSRVILPEFRSWPKPGPGWAGRGVNRRSRLPITLQGDSAPAPASATWSPAPGDATSRGAAPSYSVT